MASDTSNQDAWKLKALEDDRAIGGLRNPHLSIQKLKGDLTRVDQLRAIIDAKVTAGYESVVEALATIGKEEMPDVLAQAAKEIRQTYVGHTVWQRLNQAHCTASCWERLDRDQPTPISRQFAGCRKARRP